MLLINKISLHFANIIVTSIAGYPFLNMASFYVANISILPFFTFYLIRGIDL